VFSRLHLAVSIVIFEKDIEPAKFSTSTFSFELSYFQIDHVVMLDNKALLNVGLKVTDVLFVFASVASKKSATNCNVPALSNKASLNVNQVLAAFKSHSATKDQFNHNSKLSTHVLSVTITKSLSSTASASSNVHSATTTSSDHQGVETFPRFVFVTLIFVPWKVYTGAVPETVGTTLADVLVSVALNESISKIIVFPKSSKSSANVA
jgi:hypothetical protein